VGILSNFLGLRDGRHADPPPILRPVSPREIEHSLRLILGGHGGAVTEQHVQEFLTFSGERGIDLALIWVAEQGGRVVQAVLPVISPGKTMLLFVSAPPSKAAEATLSRLIEDACAAASHHEVHLAQALIDPQEDVLLRVYTNAGFGTMAELIYLSTVPRAGILPPVLPAGLRWLNYSAHSHDAFATAITASYKNSLDCPALNGLRGIDDVIDGHKSSGVFNPEEWFVLADTGDRPLGVLLLAASGRGENVTELIYLGLSPAARGRKLSELLMKQALAVVAREKERRLSLAVDSRNVPALKLYYRHGMSRVASKIALMKDLRPS
jgi:GNAT superfamily N-acetyltransferase